jgi:hypothetical protein
LAILSNFLASFDMALKTMTSFGSCSMFILNKIYL